VKSKTKTHSFRDDIVIPEPYIDINKAIFEKVEGSREYTKDSLMYQDILKYGIKHPYENGFRFTEIAKWLMRNNIEMKNYYADNKTPMYARIGNRRQRIASCLHNLVRLGLLIEKDKVKAERNNELTPLYDFTREGYLLGAIINVSDDFTTREGYLEALEHVFNILKTYSDINDSFILTFIIRFFKKEFEGGQFAVIVDFFLRTILPRYRVENGRELLKLFLGVRHSLNWIIPFPDSFLDTLHELDAETKKMVLFHFKLEIEEYYKENYLVEELRIMEFHNEYARREKKGRKIIDIPGGIAIIPPIIREREDYSKLIAIPGKEWHLMRFNNISDYSTVTIPGFCIRCNTEGAFLYDTRRYLDNIICFYIRHDPGGYPYGKCSKCNNNYGLSAHVMWLPHFTTVW
jgi:hypothetical protein